MSNFRKETIIAAKRAKELYEKEGLSFRKIAKKMEEEGFQTSKGKPYSKSSIERMAKRGSLSHKSHEDWEFDEGYIDPACRITVESIGKTEQFGLFVTQWDFYKQEWRKKLRLATFSKRMYAWYFAEYLENEEDIKLMMYEDMESWQTQNDYELEQAKRLGASYFMLLRRLHSEMEKRR